MTLLFPTWGHLIAYMARSGRHGSVSDAIDDTPNTSLARRDLIKQAEILQQAQQTATDQELSPGLVINIMLDELRQQAKELSDD